VANSDPGLLRISYVSNMEAPASKFAAGAN
jgi:hypothetical protein